MMGNGKNRGNLRKNAKYLAIEKGLKGGSQEKKESRECKVPKTRGLGTYNPSPSPSPFLISYLPADIMKRSQGSARRGEGSLETPSSLLYSPQVSTETCCLQDDIL